MGADRAGLRGVGGAAGRAARSAVARLGLFSSGGASASRAALARGAQRGVSAAQDAGVDIAV